MDRMSNDTKKRNRRPKPFSVGTVRVRVIRGPHKEDGQRWYFRAERYEGTDGRTVWTGWGTVAEVMRAVAALVAEGQEIAPRAARPRDTLCETIRDLLEFWIGEQETRSESHEIRPGTLKSRRGSARHLTRLIGDVHVDRITSHTLETYKDRRLREGTATSSVAVEIEAFLMAWSWGAERGLNPKEPLRRPTIKQTPVMDKYTPTVQEFRDVLDALPVGRTGPWAANALRVIGYTGARPGEIAALTWGDIDFTKCEIRIPASGKTGRRTVAVPPELMEHLEAYRGDREPAPTERVWPITAGSFRAWLPKLVAEACDAVKCPRWSPKGLRRMMADQYRRAGVDVATYMAQMGHSIRIALRDYQQATRADQHRAAALINLGDREPQILQFPKRGGA